MSLPSIGCDIPWSAKIIKLTLDIPGSDSRSTSIQMTTSKLGKSIWCQASEQREACCVAGCLSLHHSSDSPLFSFPENKTRCCEWLQNIGRQDLVGKSVYELHRKGYRVCSSHFQSDHVLPTIGGKVRLRPKATPSLVRPGKRRSRRINSNTSSTRETKGETADQSQRAAKRPALRVQMSEGQREACCVAGCQSARHSSDGPLFDFPADKTRCKKWLQNIGRKDLLGKSPHQLRRKGYRVCSDHFKSDDVLSAGQKVKLCRNAEPVMLTSGKRRQRKKKSDPPEEPPAVSMLPPPEVKVEVEWEEEANCSAGVLAPSGSPEEQAYSANSISEWPLPFGAAHAKVCSEPSWENLSPGKRGTYTRLKPQTQPDLQSASGFGHGLTLPGTADCDMDTASNRVDCIKSKPVEEGEESYLSVKSENFATSPNAVDCIKSEPVEEGEEMCLSVNNENLDPSPSINIMDCIKSEPVEETCVPVTSESLKACCRVGRTVADAECPTVNSENTDVVHSALDCQVQLTNSALAMNIQPFDKDGREQTNQNQPERGPVIYKDVMSDEESVDSCEQLSGHGRQTLFDVIEEDDVDMTYTVVKAEPESDAEEQ
ncbi:hypothetical protein ACOMHN_039408 [Nucella lapillus]